MIDKIFGWLFATIVVLAILPCIVSIVVHTLGPVLFTAGIVTVIIGVYRSWERARLRSAKPRHGSGGERTPILPRGEE